MGVQDMMDAIDAQNRRDRSDYHLTLGQLRDACYGVGQETPVVCENLYTGLMLAGALGRFDSYRGYYSDLAFQPGFHPMCLAWVVANECDWAMGRIYGGYKGGDFEMGADTPLWISDYGKADQKAVIGVRSARGLITVYWKQLEA